MLCTSITILSIFSIIICIMIKIMIHHKNDCDTGFSKIPPISALKKPKRPGKNKKSVNFPQTSNEIEEPRRTKEKTREHQNEFNATYGKIHVTKPSLTQLHSRTKTLNDN